MQLFIQAPVTNHVESSSIQQPTEYPQSPLSPAAPSDMKEEMMQATIIQYSYELPLKKKRRRPVSGLLSM